MWEIASLAELYIEGGEFTAKAFVGNENPKYDAAARIAIRIIKQQRHKRLLAHIGGLEDKTDEQLYGVITAYQYEDEDVSLQALDRIRDKSYLKRIHASCSNRQLLVRTEQRFHEVVQAEANARGFFAYLKYLAFGNKPEDRLF